MRNTKTERWKQELKKGVLEVTNLQILGTMTSEAVLTELRSIFPILFLEGRKQDKVADVAGFHDLSPHPPLGNATPGQGTR